MAETTIAEQRLATSLEEPLERLLAFEPSTFPVVSLYLDAQADSTGRASFQSFLRKELSLRAKTFAASSPEKESFEKDVEKIERWLEENLESSANGAAIFACHAADLWETVQLHAPVGESRLYVYNQPHLYHLARLSDEFPKYAAVVTDANSARVFVFGLGQTLEIEPVQGKKVQRVKVGGWSQARYQRRVDNAQSSHIKEVVDALDRLVKQESLSHIVLAGDATITSSLSDALPKELAEKVVDTVGLSAKATDQEVLASTFDAMRRADSETDAQKVERLLGEYRRGGLGCVGPNDTLEALANGQVDELLISSQLETVYPEEQPVEAILAPEVPDASGSTETEEPRPVLLADLLVTKAKQTDAAVTFIEDAALLERVDGVGALLRWRT